MRWKITILVLAFTVSACTLGAPTETTPEVLPSPIMELLPASETPTPNIVSVQPSPIPTQTLTPTPTQSPTETSSRSIPVAEENRIQFPTGATWVEVGTHLNEGASIEYVLSALKGQVMSVSIEQNWPFTVEVADSATTLTEPDNERPFWRGTLPATGDYFIKVKTQATGDFTLRVAINPPGQTYQYFDYENPQQTATLRYSDEFAPTINMPVGEFKGTPSLVLEFIRPEFFSPTTNLGEAYFLFSTIVDAGTVATCTQPLPQLEEISGQETINGYTFTKSQAIGVAAGNIYDQVIYRTVYENICYEAVFYMHSGNIGNYTSGTVVEFDRGTLLQKFEGILDTFTVQ
jgi:hypothetical protein